MGTLNLCPDWQALPALGDGLEWAAAGRWLPLSRRPRGKYPRISSLRVARDVADRDTRNVRGRQPPISGPGLSSGVPVLAGSGRSRCVPHGIPASARISCQRFSRGHGDDLTGIRQLLLNELPGAPARALPVGRRAPDRQLRMRAGASARCQLFPHWNT